MDRRDLVRRGASATVLALVSSRLGSHWVWAQAVADFAALGLPELKVVLTADGYQVSPTTTTAGWTLVTFENHQSAGDNSADIMAIPAGETAASLFAGPASPAAGPPAWLYEATFAGAPWAPAGAAARAVILLTAGDWLVFNGGEPRPPVPLTVTEGPASAASSPALTAAVAVTLQEFAFVGLEQPVPSGRQIWQVTNTGQQPHLMILSALPDGTTQAQFMDALTAMMTGTPAADAITPEEIRTVGGCATLSTGQSLYLDLDLPSGTYGAICFFPDQVTGAPHVLMGMSVVFTVA